MSLDKQIKEMAAKQLDELQEAAERAILNVCTPTPLNMPELARLVSGHKTQTTRDACIKKLSDKISADMLASITVVDEVTSHD